MEQDNSGMDDLSRKRLEAEISKAEDAMPSLMTNIGNIIGDARALPSTEINAMFERIGIPVEATGDAFFWASFTMGRMIGHGVGMADAVRMFEAISGIKPEYAYDICGDDQVVAELDKIPSGCELEHRYTASDVYRWARFLRAGICEIYFALEDHFVDPVHVTGAELWTRAVAGVKLLLEMQYPIFEKAAKGV